MIRARVTDVLLVGPGRAADAAAISSAGHEVELAPSCLAAILHLSRSPARVVVLSSRDLGRGERDAIAAVKESGEMPQVLLSLPPESTTSPLHVAGLGADDCLAEPWLPETLLGKVERLLERARDRAEGLPVAGITPLLGTDALARILDDTTGIHRSVSSLDRLASALLDAFRRRSGARRVSLMLHDRRRSDLVLRDGLGLPAHVDRDHRIPLGERLAGAVAEVGRPLLVPDVREEPWRHRRSGGDYHGLSCLLLPLVVRKNVLGVVSLADKANGQEFTEEDLAVLGALAGPAAQALENALSLRRLRALSLVDDLTGLYNRRHFRRTLQREFRRAERHGHALTLAILDVDHFKLYNDGSGHEAGNRALRRIGRILRRSFRASDIVCRYGGEEFAAILPETEKGETFVPETEDGTFGAFRFIERLRGRIEKTRFENEEQLPGGRLTISGGVASYPTDARTVDELVEAADRSLYLAKAEGRNRVHIA